MNLKTIATLAATLVATSAFAAGNDAKCGAGSCGKKEAVQKDAACSKKDEGKDAACSKKDASCSKKDEGKDAACAKK